MKQLFDDDRRGQVGIGTLIVFIAMVLVAAIAAGVLINTAGFLQTQAEDTGTESTEQVADNLNVITEVGNVSSDDTINEVRVGVQPASGSDDINLAKLTVQYVSDDSFENLVVANKSTTEQATGDTSTGELELADPNDIDGAQYLLDVITAENEDDIVMTDGADRYEVVIPLANETLNAEDQDGSDNTGTASLVNSNFDQGDLGPLAEGEELELRITTEVGAQTVAFLQVPDSLSGDDGGSTVNL